MAKPPERRRAKDPFKAAEDVFRPAVPELPDEQPKPAALPGARETVTLRIDRDVLDHFQADGPGWQDRINAVLRKSVGK
jgi:uncharacterized protein (DUF4415 family)